MRWRASLILVLLVAGCAPPPQGSSKYANLYGGKQVSPRPAKTGNKAGDYRWAVSAPTLSDAAEAWEEFLKTHYPTDDVEDSPDWQRLTAARCELARVYYMLGRQKEGDDAFRKVDPIRILWLDPPKQAIKPNPEIHYYRDGSKQEERYDRYRTPKGTHTRWYTNGQKKWESTYDKGRMRYWFRSGQLCREEFHDRGRAGTWSEWDSKGDLICRGTYENGEPWEGTFNFCN